MSATNVSVNVSITPHAHCIRPFADLIDFALADPELHCGSVYSVGSVSCVQKLRKMFTFQAATDPSANQIVAQSANTTPAPVRHAFRRPLTDGRSGKAA